MHKEVVEEKEVVRKDAVDIKARLLSAMTKVPLLTLLSKANRSNYKPRVRYRGGLIRRLRYY